MLTSASYKAALCLSMVLAMMVLGGDPQMAYHAGLAGGAYAAGLWWSRTSVSETKSTRWQSAIRLAAPLVVAAIGSFVLSAIQVLPASEASKLSDRSAYHAPRSIYEAAHVIATKENGVAIASEGLFRDPQPDTHAASIYQFSFAPWHLAEYLWPNFAGQYFPYYRRWMMAWPSEPRMWNQSVYMGLLPILLGVGALRLRTGTTREQWLSWCVVLAVLGSFGSFGIGWLIRHPLYLAGYPKVAAQMPGDQVGGLYWLFVTLLPSYAYFRFPAKLLTFAALPLCLLAAQGLDRLQQSSSPRLMRVLLIIVGVSGVGAFAVTLGSEWFAHLTSSIAPDTVFGPFDTQGAHTDLLRSILHTLVVSLLLFVLLKWKPQRTALSLVAITAAEIVIANAPMIATAPSDLWRMRPLLAEIIERDGQQRHTSIRPTVRYPVEHDTIDPGGWHATSSPYRLEELAAADRHLAQLNHCLAGPIDSVDCLASQRLADHTYFYKRFHHNEESFWGNYWIMPRSLPSIGAPGNENPWEPIDHGELAESTKCKLFGHREPFPRAWIVHEVELLPEVTSRDPHELSQRSSEVCEADGNRRDFRHSAVVESDQPVSPTPEAPTTLAAKPCQIVESRPNRIVVDVVLSRPGLLVLGDTYYPGWIATSEKSGNSLPILRTDRMFRGVALAAGKDRIILEYRPKSLYFGAIISGIGWAALAILVLVSIRRTSDL